MNNVLTLISQPGALDTGHVNLARSALEALGAETTPPDWLGEAEAVDIGFDTLPTDSADAAVRKTFREALGDVPVDVIAQSAGGRKKKLLMADMDSTIVTAETLNELADFAGFKDEVAALTQRAMNGEIGFDEALKTRVAMLKGLNENFLERAFTRIELSPGAQVLVATMRKNKAYTALISGGFSFFADKVRDWVGFHRAYSNHLIMAGGKLTGTVREPILNKDSKLKGLIEIAAKHRMAMAETLAIGDGANDVPMIQAAGLGIAYHAHPIAREAARARLDHCDLTGALFIQGFRRNDFCYSIKR